MYFKGIISNENDKELSPSEQRALNAEKKAAWRQARLKSLEQVIKILLSHEILNIFNFIVFYRTHCKHK